jgi:hypothetical protein
MGIQFHVLLFFSGDGRIILQTACSAKPLFPFLQTDQARDARRLAAIPYPLLISTTRRSA